MVLLRPRFSSTGSAAFAQRFQQHEILHVARADLHHVGIVRDQIDVAIAHHFGDDRQAGGFLGLLQQLQAFFFHALEIVGRSARLEGAAAQELGAGFGDRFGGAHDLVFAFDGARPGDDDEFVAANFRAVHLDARFALAKFLADELVGRGDAHDVFDLRHDFDGFQAGA